MIVGRGSQGKIAREPPNAVTLPVRRAPAGIPRGVTNVAVLRGMLGKTVIESLRAVMAPVRREPVVTRAPATTARVLQDMQGQTVTGPPNVVTVLAGMERV